MPGAEDAINDPLGTISDAVSDPLGALEGIASGVGDYISDAGDIVEGVASDLGSELENYYGTVTEPITGKEAKEAAEDAAEEQAKAAVEASDAQLQLGRESIAFQKESLAETRAGLEPFRAPGVEAIGGLPALLQQQQTTISDPSSRVLNNPFFKALAGQQEQRLLQSAAARGKVGSGQTGQDLQQNLLLLGNQFGQQDIANQQLGISNLQNLSTIGANAAAGQGTATQQTAGMVGNTLGNMGIAQAQGITGAANANAAGMIGAANATGQGLSNAASLVGSIFGFGNPFQKGGTR